MAQTHVNCRGQARGYAKHADNTTDCPDLLAPSWVHYWKGKWYKAGQKMVVKCDSNPANITNAKQNSLNVVSTEMTVTRKTTTITTPTNPQAIQMTGMLKFQ